MPTLAQAILGALQAEGLAIDDVSQVLWNRGDSPIPGVDPWATVDRDAFIALAQTRNVSQVGNVARASIVLRIVTAEPDDPERFLRWDGAAFVVETPPPSLVTLTAADLAL